MGEKWTRGKSENKDQTRKKLEETNFCSFSFFLSRLHLVVVLSCHINYHRLKFFNCCCLQFCFLQSQFWCTYKTFQFFWFIFSITTASEGANEKKNNSILKLDFKIAKVNSDHYRRCCWSYAVFFFFSFSVLFSCRSWILINRVCGNCISINLICNETHNTHTH